MGKTLRKFARFGLTVGVVAIAANLLFFALHYASLFVPQELIKARVAQGFDNRNLVHEPYPSHRYGFSSNYTGIGLDHYMDCLIVLMAMYREPDRLRNAVIPRIAESEQGGTEECENAELIAKGKLSISDSASRLYVRYWFGAKVLATLALRYLDFFEINNLIKAFSYLGYFLLSISIIVARRDLLLPTIPLAVFGIGFFGINYHGGMANSLPHLLTVYLLIAIVLLRHVSARWLGVYFAIAGALLSFVYFMDGSLILFFSVSLYLLYFINFRDQPIPSRYLSIFGMLTCFTGAFAGSFLVKQLVTTIYINSERVFGLFWSSVSHRISGPLEGKAITAADAVEKQLEYYRLAIFDWQTGAELVTSLSLLAWLVALLITVYLFYGKRDTDQLHRFVIVSIAGVLVFVRYMLLRNQTYIHVIFISRYLSVFYLFGWVALAQGLQSLARYVPAIGIRMGSFPALLRVPDAEADGYRKHRNVLHLTLAGLMTLYLLYRLSL